MVFAKISRCSFLLILFLSGFLFAQEDSLKLPYPLQKFAKEMTQAVMLLDYDKALAIAWEIKSKDSGAGCVWENMILISRFDDLGDTLDMIRADQNLSECKAGGLWETLRDFEKGFTQSALGHSVKGALGTRAAAKVFGESEDPDARAFFAVYAYYVDQSFSWVPFFSDNREEYIRVLRERSLHSELFAPLFGTSLIWIYYDRGEFQHALALADQFLVRYPGHPVFLQIRADMLYALKNYEAAAAIYEKSAAEYPERSGYSIRYWCAVMNLILIYGDMGNTEKKEAWLKRLDHESFRALKRWLPASLLQSLKKKSGLQV
ncbi:MAG: tetratricopeptide repeat protein [Fibrobacter sp.]|nr:tetratricopeptide repeat protein [Fibrobacter sp.]